MRRFLVLCFLLAVTSPVHARNTEHFYSVADALRDGQGASGVDDGVRLFMDGRKHPKIDKSFGVWETRKSTRGVLRSDEAACHVAFLSAILQLQKRARQEGGNAVVDIVSITRGMETRDAERYRCVAGATVAHVALRGRVVRLK